MRRSSLDNRRSNVATENKDQEPETASAALADGMHFVGNTEGFRIDLDAEESVGGVGAGPSLLACCCRLWLAAPPWMSSRSCVRNANRSAASAWKRRGAGRTSTRGSTPGSKYSTGCGANMLIRRL